MHRIRKEETFEKFFNERADHPDGTADIGRACGPRACEHKDRHTRNKVTLIVLNSNPKGVAINV